MKKDRFLKGIFGTISILIFSITAMAQERLVTGIVRDEKNSPLNGATVSVKNNKATTVTKPLVPSR